MANDAQPVRILVVEDNPLVRDRVADIAGAAFSDVRVGEASTVEQAREHLRSDRWDLVLLDLNLPGSRGIDTLVQVRKTDARVPVIVVSGLPEDTYGPASLRAGAVAFVPKERAAHRLAGEVVAAVLGPGERQARKVKPIVDAGGERCSKRRGRRG